MRRSVLALLAAFTTLAACASGGPRNPAYDGSFPRDFGDRDTGAPLDLGAPDLGAADLGVDLGAEFDLGAELDLGGDVDLGPSTPDLGPADLGATDLGPPDLGPRDLGPTDLGPPDLGPTDLGTSCSESPCRLVSPQCGCSGGLACSISGTVRACATAGTGAVGAACGTALPRCAAGNLCVGVSTTTTTAACEHFCNSDADCTGAGALCLLTLDDGTGASIPGVTLCSLSCNLATNTGCPSGSACRLYSESAGAGRSLTHCAGPAGTGTEGALCTTDAECIAGYTCADTGYGNECTQWCNYTTGTGCALGYTCAPFSVAVVIGSTEYGVCIW
jgi:hypothetical protein